MSDRKTFVKTGLVRFSYAHVLEPKEDENGNLKYQTSIIIPKSDTKTLRAIERAVDAAIAEGSSKLTKPGGKKPIPKKNLKLPLRDGDEEREGDEAYENAMFFNASSKNAPAVVDDHVLPIGEDEFYSGCYGRVTVNFYAFDGEGKQYGIAAGLGNIQKLQDGEPLAGGTTAQQDFGDDDVSDFTDELGEEEDDLFGGEEEEEDDLFG